MKNRKLTHALCQCIPVCVIRYRNVCYHSGTPLLLHSVGNLNALHKYWTKKLPRIQVNKSNPKFTFRAVYLKDPTTSTHRGHNTIFIAEETQSFWNCDTRNDGSHSAFWFKMGRAKVLAVVRILVLLFITSWERVNMGVVKQSSIPITPGETLLKEKRK